MKKKKLSGKLILGKHKISNLSSSKIIGGTGNTGEDCDPIINLTVGGGDLPRGCASIDNFCGPMPSAEGTPSICICM